MRNDQIIDLVMDFVHHTIVKENSDKENMKIIIRTNNGPQFIAKQLARALDSIGITHEYIYPGTPEQNGHIESSHNTVTRLVCNRNIFGDIIHARNIFQDFFFVYDNTRVMKSLLYYPPKQFLELRKSGLIGIKKDKRNKEIFFFREKALPNMEVGSSSEDLGVINKNNIFKESVLKPLEISPV